ncbi:Hypothetical_protein [Hexamita inflata]|uniref:Hypothetical_protein n=1 Tax=Hexamita inflata TaxID=28002 RepID=A0ABP1H8P1_9EUKA
MVEVVFENFVNYLRSGNTDKLNIISFQQKQQHKINLSTQLIFDRILTKTVVQLSDSKLGHQPSLRVSTTFESLQQCIFLLYKFIDFSFTQQAHIFLIVSQIK